MYSYEDRINLYQQVGDIRLRYSIEHEPLGGVDLNFWNLGRRLLGGQNAIVDTDAVKLPGSGTIAQPPTAAGRSAVSAPTFQEVAPGLQRSLREIRMPVKLVTKSTLR